MVASDLDDAAGAELDALDGLGSLLDKSLVRPLDATDGDGMPRVVMLETIKAYATAQLDTRPDFAEAARESHAGYFADLARAATTESAAAELDNLRIAWANAVGRKDLKRLGDLREALWPIYEARGWYHATIQLADDLLAVQASSPERPDDWQTQLTLMTSRAKAITLLRGYTAEAEDAYAEALALVKEHGEVPQLFPVLRNLGSFYGYRGEVDKANRVRDGDPQARRHHRRRGHAGHRLHVPRREHRVRRAARVWARLPRPGHRDVREQRLRAAAGCAWGWTRGCRA